MNLVKYFHNLLVLLTFILAFGAASTAFGAATIVIAINDPAGIGFNDPTLVTPIGGNPGTTLGEQRLNAFREAARIWGETLSSNPTITIRAQWTALTCTSTSAVLGSAGAVNILNNFPNAPFLNTWYSAALANKLSDADLIPANPEINANFNVNLGSAGCLTGSPFYLGYDGNEGTGVDLVAVLLHEFGHGLGFQTFTSGTTGAPTAGLPSVYDRFLFDNTTGKSWLNMTNAERVASALNSRNLAWNGPQVQADVPSVLALGTPLIRINTPAAIAGVYPVGTASFGPALTSPGITADIVQAIDPSDGAGPSTTDGCSPFSNASAVAGKIALVDRGTCGFVVKALNAQNAGAVALVVADNAAGGPPANLGGADPNIIIPAVRITLEAGNLIKAQLASGVSATLTLDNTVRQGADTFGKALVYTPNPFQSGSSVSHWDTSASPNLLMEPAINTDLTHQVTANADLTYSLFQDLGWTPSTLPSVILSSGGNLQSAGVNQPFAAPLQVTVSPAVEGLTVTFKANATDGASGTFATSGSRPTAGNGGDAVAVIANTPLATAVTNAQGVATSPVFSANGRAGTYSVNATVPGAGSTTFQLVNLAPTAAAASVSGRILTADGRGIMGAIVTLTTQNGEQRTVRSNGFGYYGFNHLAVGETIVVEVTSKRYSFQTQVLTLSADLTDFNFVALP